MEIEYHKLSKKAKQLSLKPDRYRGFLSRLGLNPMVFPDNPNDELVSEVMHQSVIGLLSEKPSALDSGLEDKDLRKIIDEKLLELKKEYKIKDKRNLAPFFTPEKTAAFRRVVNEVNNHYNQVFLKDEKLKRTIININFFKVFSWSYDPTDKTPMLKMKASKRHRHGQELFLEFRCPEQKKVNGILQTKERLCRINGGLNSITDPETLYIYAFKLIFYIFNKQKSGYILKYTAPKTPRGITDIENTPAHKLLLIPTLYSYVEFFKQVKAMNKHIYDSIKSDLNTLTRFIHKLYRLEKIKLENLNHTIPFLAFKKPNAISFKEHLQTEIFPKSGKVICDTTIGNIFSNLGNLTNRIIEKRPDLNNHHYINPFLDHGITPSDPERHEIYNTEQLIQLGEAILELKDQQLWVFTKCLYHSGVRRIELERMKIKYISLNANRPCFHLPNGITKNSKSRSVPISPPLKLILEGMHLSEYPGDYHLFTSSKVPGPNQASKNYFINHFNKAKFKCDKLTRFHDLYSMRHTFSMKFMLQDIDKSKREDESRTIQLMEILGHASIRETQKYLRKIGYQFLSQTQFKGISDDW